MGGINAAGRTSGHQGFKRTLLEVLSEQERQSTLVGLASLMGQVQFQQGQAQDAQGRALSASVIAQTYADYIQAHTLIRRIEPHLFDVNAIPAARLAKLKAEQGLKVRVRKRQLPDHIPANWQVRDVEKGEVELWIPEALDALLPDQRQALVQAAGQLPTGFDPSRLYRSAHHPRGLQMAIFAASDLLGSCGIPWEAIQARVNPDQIGVYASNSIGQLDQEGWGGLLQSFISGKRATAKQMPLGYGQMTADFINAYVLGNLGMTGGTLGACASFLYNLQAAVRDIRSGRCRAAFVGSADAPVTPEIIEGFRAMGALADDASLLALDGKTQLADDDYRRACRPFAPNCGFTIAEAAHFILLTDDSLALELGAHIHAAVPDVFVNADGFKRSISAPGIGNYLTLAKAAALGRTLVGEQGLRHGSFVHAHGTSTPKNRVTESHVINEVAKAFGITDWPVAAVKCFVGHSQGSAGADQLVSALGTWAQAWLPGIRTSTQFADDIYDSNLKLSDQHTQIDPAKTPLAFINAKGFGGNNATALLLSPQATQDLLAQRHGQAALKQHAQTHENVAAQTQAYLQAADQGEFKTLYHFGESVLEGPELVITENEIQIPGYARSVDLKLENPFL
nr:beta-ketoacyl synthase [Allopseudospirillum japonicum]